MLIVGVPNALQVIQNAKPGPFAEIGETYLLVCGQNESRGRHSVSSIEAGPRALVYQAKVKSAFIASDKCVRIGGPRGDQPISGDSI
jgi:hypothetical protein